MEMNIICLQQEIRNVTRNVHTLAVPKKCLGRTCKGVERCTCTEWALFMNFKNSAEKWGFLIVRGSMKFINITIGDK